VRLDYFVGSGWPAGRRLDDKSALGPYRNDDRVLDRLGLHQVKDLGAEVIGPVAPTDTAPRNFAGPQMASLHPRTVDVDFVKRRQFRQVSDFRALEFQHD